MKEAKKDTRKVFTVRVENDIVEIMKRRMKQLGVKNQNKFIKMAIVNFIGSLEG